MDFNQAEEKFQQLKSRFEAGGLAEAEFKAQLHDLMVEDEQGNWWMIGYETGLWHRHDGTNWVQADPPGTGPRQEKPVIHAVRAPGPAVAEGRSRWIWVLLGVAALVAIGLILRPYLISPLATPTLPSPDVTKALTEQPSIPVGQLLTGHTAAVNSLAFSPDGKILASGSDDNTIRLWDVASRQQVGEPLTGHIRPVYSVAFSPDGKTLASGGFDNTIILWDVASRQPIGAPLTGHFASVSSVVFSPDGKTLASAGADRNIFLWNVASRQPTGGLHSAASPVDSVAFSPDGKMLALGNWDNTIILWDVASGQDTGTALIRHADSVSSVAFSPDGKMLASGSDDSTIRLWDVASRQPFELLRGHDGAVYSVAFNPDGKMLASGGADGTIRLWNVGGR